MPLRHGEAWGIACLGRFLQSLTTLPVKKYFLTSSLNLPWYSFQLFPHVLTGSHEEETSSCVQTKVAPEVSQFNSRIKKADPGLHCSICTIPWGWSCFIPLQIPGTLVFRQGFHSNFWGSHTGAEKCIHYGPVNFRTFLIPANVVAKLRRNSKYLDSPACKQHFFDNRLCYNVHFIIVIS